MAETKIADTYAKLAEKVEGKTEHCNCGSQHFRVVVEHEHRNARVRITCVRCGMVFLGLWAPDWQVEQYAWAKHARDAGDTACIQCGKQWFALKTQHDRNILLVRVCCNKCGQQLMKFGAAEYQLT